MDSRNERSGTQHPEGVWNRTRPRAGRASAPTETQGNGIDRARAHILCDWVGEPAKDGSEGRLRDSDSAPPGNDPSPPARRTRRGMCRRLRRPRHGAGRLRAVPRDCFEDQVLGDSRLRPAEPGYDLAADHDHPFRTPRHPDIRRPQARDVCPALGRDHRQSSPIVSVHAERRPVHKETEPLSEEDPLKETADGRG